MPIQAPNHLSSGSGELYRRLAEDYRLDHEPHALEVLRLACEALDRCAQAREAIERDGPFVTNRFGEKRPHPGIGVERVSRIAALRALRELSLDGEAPNDVRPSRLR
jgi:phage terminase small subunit